MFISIAFLVAATFLPTYRAHKEVLFFASPFFEAALSGNWAETGRPQSVSSVITISQPSGGESKTEMSFAPMDSDIDVSTDDEPETSDTDVEAVDTPTSDVASESDTFVEPSSPAPRPKRRSKSSVSKDKARNESLAKLQSANDRSKKRLSSRRRPDAVIVLKEERVRGGTLVSDLF